MFDVEFTSALNSNSIARKCFNMFEEAVGRLVLPLSLKTEFDHSVSGKFTAEKMDLLRSAWLRHIQKEHDGLVGVAEKFGLQDDGKMPEKDEV